MGAGSRRGRMLPREFTEAVWKRPTESRLAAGRGATLGMAATGCRAEGAGLPAAAAGRRGLHLSLIGRFEAARGEQLVRVNISHFVSPASGRALLAVARKGGRKPFRTPVSAVTSRRRRHTLATRGPLPRVWRSPRERLGGVRGPQPTRIKRSGGSGVGPEARPVMTFFHPPPPRRKFSAPPPGSWRERVVSSGLRVSGSQ